MVATSADIFDDEEENEELEIISEISTDCDQFEIGHNIPKSLGIANTAGRIEALLQRNNCFTCEDCSSIFEINEKVSQNVFIKNKANILPCKSTFAICNICSEISAIYFASVHESDFSYDDLVKKIRLNIRYEDLYTQTCFEHDIGHKDFLVNFIIDECIRICATARARKLTLDQQNAFLRQKKNA